MTNPDDIDAQFRDLVAQMGNEPTTGDPNNLDAPVDESLHLDGGRLSVALVLAPLPRVSALHALLTISKIRVDNVVRLKPWTAVWLPVETRPTDEDELDALLANNLSMPDNVDHVARAISRFSKYGSVAIMSWLVEGDGVEPGVSGRISARRYVGGEPEEEIPAGLLLGTLPQAAEDLLLGRTRPEDYSDSIVSDGKKRPRRGPSGWLGRK